MERVNRSEDGGNDNDESCVRAGGGWWEEERYCRGEERKQGRRGRNEWVKGSMRCV